MTPVNIPSYLTGLTALSIPIPGRAEALPHTHLLTNSRSWQWAGVQVNPTDDLLGNTGLYDATETLRCFAPGTPENTWAASYERALFDYIHHCLTLGQGVIKKIQPRDIDDAVDYALIMSWVHNINLPSRITRMFLDWLHQGFIGRTIVSYWTIYRILDDAGRRSRGAYLTGRIVASNDPSEDSKFISSAQLLDIDIFGEARVGSHYRDYYLDGTGREQWVTLRQFRTLRQQIDDALVG